MLNKKGKTMNSKYLYYMLILKSSKTIIAELTIKQEKQIVDCLKENAPERVYDGQFTNISGKVWNYSDVEKSIIFLLMSTCIWTKYIKFFCL